MLVLLVCLLCVFHSYLIILFFDIFFPLVVLIVQLLKLLIYLALHKPEVISKLFIKFLVLKVSSPHFRSEFVNELLEHKGVSGVN